jgi:cold shock protein
LPLESALFRRCSISFALGEIIRVAMGTAKWFNPSKGNGFIKPDVGGPDVFVHISSVEKAGYTGLAEGVRISYQLLPSRSGKISAENLRLG